MTNEWQRVFADAIKPIWMRAPFNIERFKKYFPFFLHLVGLLLEIIKDHTVVNSFYFGFFSVVVVK